MPLFFPSVVYVINEIRLFGTHRTSSNSPSWSTENGEKKTANIDSNDWTIARKKRSQKYSFNKSKRFSSYKNHHSRGGGTPMHLCIDKYQLLTPAQRTRSNVPKRVTTNSSFDPSSQAVANEIPSTSHWMEFQVHPMSVDSVVDTEEWYGAMYSKS